MRNIFDKIKGMISDNYENLYKEVSKKNQSLADKLDNFLYETNEDLDYICKNICDSAKEFITFSMALAINLIFKILIINRK